MTKKKVPKRWVPPIKPLGFGDIAAGFVTSEMIQIQERPVMARDYLLLELAEARALRDWLTEALK